MLGFMLGQTAADCIERAGALSAETFEYAKRLDTQLRTLMPRPKSGQRAVDQARGASKLRRFMIPLLEFVFTRIEEIVGEIRLALRVQEFADIPETTWQMALVLLRQQRQLLVDTCGRLQSTFRRLKAQSPIVAAAWRPEWDERYEASLEALEDLEETIALGLDPSTRADLEQRDRDSIKHPA
jgi:hypothetical protein